jgi:hypothetical protein
VLVSGARRLLILAATPGADEATLWKGLEYDPAAAFGPWEGFALVDARVCGAADDTRRADGVRRLVALVRERGPLPYRPEQAREFAEQVGIAPVTGALLLSDCRGSSDSTETGCCPPRS